MYPITMEDIMDKIAVFDWFERFIRVTKNLITKEYVVLSDVESYHTWIEFKRKKNDLIISIVKADKWQSSKDIEFHLENSRPGEWGNQMIEFEQFKEEIVRKGRKYLNDILEYNSENELVGSLKIKLEELWYGLKRINSI